MKEEIYKYYINDLSSRKLVFRFMKIRWACLIVLSIVTCVYSFAYFITYNYKAVIIILIPYAFYFNCVNHWAKKIIKDKYNIKSDSYIWGGDSYYNLRKVRMITYLKSKNIYNGKKIKELIDICSKEIENQKKTGFINWGIFLAIFVPLWAQFLSVIFNNSVKTISDAQKAFVGISLLIIYVFIILTSIKLIFQDILNDYINKRSNGYRKLTNMLEDIIFEIDIEN